MFTVSFGDEEYLRSVDTPLTDRDRIVDEAKACLRKGRFEEAYNRLMDIAQNQDPEAVFLVSLFSHKGETESEFSKRHFRGVNQAAKSGYPDAVYVLGFYYDTGEHVEKDEYKASRLFQKAARLGHARSEWIHGMDVLEGRHGFMGDHQIGLSLIRSSAKKRFQGAIETLIRANEEGLFGLTQDLEGARKLRSLLDDPDLIEN